MTNDKCGSAERKKVFSYLGFAARCGRISLGADQVIAAVRKSGGKNIAVILASDASDRTKKQIKDKCSSYGASLLPVSVTGDELARAVGKSMTLSCVACSDESLASALVKLFDAVDDGGTTQLEERIFPPESGKR